MNPIYILIIFATYVILEFIQNMFNKASFFSITKFCQLFLLVYSVFYLVYIEVLPRNLFTPHNWLLGLVVGHILYTVGFFITMGFNKIVKEQLFSFGKVLNFSVISPTILGKTLSVAITEEIIYRGTLQTILIDTIKNPIISIIIVSLAFTLVHEHVFKNNFRQNLEFVLFALLLGFVYYETLDLGLVTTIHFIRNMESHYLEFQEKLTEEPDIDRCLTELETALFTQHGANECKAKN